MKIIFPLFLLFLANISSGQSNERRGNLAIVPSIGFNMSVLQPKVVVMNGPYALNRESVEHPECYDDNGRLVDCDQRNYHAGLGIMYRVANRSGTGGWMLFGNATFQQQTYTLNYPENRKFHIPVICTPSIMRLLRSGGVGISVGKYWDAGSANNGFQLIARMGVMASGNFKYRRGETVVTLPDSRALNYVSNGNGTIIEMYDNVPKYNVLVTPEFGIQQDNFPLELVLSLNIPVTNRVVYSELHTFAENNHIVGQNRVDYTNAVANLTARYRFDFKSKPRRVKAPKSRVEYRQPLPAAISDNSRFGRAAVKEPVRLDVFFDLERSNLRRASFTELDELVEWLGTHQTVHIRLEGHTDLVGEAAPNKRLSLDRVIAVKNYLTNKGIDAARIEVKGFGETRPISTDCPPPNYCPENRRVEMVILKK